jgi:hypothetical protein
VTNTIGKIEFPFKPRVNDQQSAQTVQRNLEMLRDSLAEVPLGEDTIITENTPTPLVGILKGNGNDIDVAVAGTDYLAPPFPPAYVLPDRLAADEKSPPGNDLNNCENGWCYAQPGSTLNAPRGDQWFHVQTYYFGGPQKFQIAYEIFTYRTYMRRMDSGAWQGWIQTWPIDDNVLPARLKSGSNLNEIQGDYNQATESGWYTGRSDDANRPTDNAAVVQVNAHSSGYIVQNAHDLASTSSWRRVNGGSGWGAWVQTWPVPAGALSGVVADASLPDRIKATAVYVSELNDLPSGWANFSPTTNNRPISGYGSVLTLQLDSSQSRQWAWQYDTQSAWMRVKLNNAWGAWQEISFGHDNTLPNRLKSAAGNYNVVSDFNAANVSGWYAANPGAANRPPRNSGYDYWIVEAQVWDTSQVHQYARELWGEMQFTRRCQNGTWGGWIQTGLESLVGGTLRRQWGGYASGTLDGNGTYRVNFPRAVTNVASVVCTNGDTSRLNVMYSAYGFDVNGFSIYGWKTDTNQPSANQTFGVSWLATVDVA